MCVLDDLCSDLANRYNIHLHWHIRSLAASAYALYLHGRVDLKRAHTKQNRLIDPAKPTLRAVVLGLSAPLTGYFNLRIVTPPPANHDIRVPQAVILLCHSFGERRVEERTERRTKAVGSE
jgi:hypothetical protein